MFSRFFSLRDPQSSILIKPLYSKSRTTISLRLLVCRSPLLDAGISAPGYNSGYYLGLHFWEGGAICGGAEETLMD